MNDNDFKKEQNHLIEADTGTPEHAFSCERAGDLMAYLYGEATEAEAENFAAHVKDCVTCQKDFASFGVVREAIGAWREESLSFSKSAAMLPTHTHVSKLNMAQAPRVRLAFAALGEFFKVSPAWMRFSTAFAALAVCALAMIGVANAEFSWNAEGVSFRTHVQPVRVFEKRIEVEKPFKVEVSDEELNARVNAGVQQRLAEIEAGQKPQTVSVAASTHTTADVFAKKRNASRQQTLAASLKQPALPGEYKATSSRVNRVEIADERDLPRLSDLLKDGSER